MNRISTDGIGPKIGTITLKDSHQGLMVLPNLRDLSPGNHAFHIHKKPSCKSGIKNGKKVAGLLAGGHYDLTKVGNIKSHSHSKKHGDLPQLVAAADGIATSSVMTEKIDSFSIDRAFHNGSSLWRQRHWKTKRWWSLLCLRSY